MSETVSTEITSEELEKTVKAESNSGKESAPKKDSKKDKKGSRFAGMKAEFKKIVWPEKATVIKNTTAVVLASIFVSIAVKVSDLLIQAVLDLLMK